MGSKWLKPALIAVLSLGVVGATRADDKKPADAPHEVSFTGGILADARADLSSRVAGTVDKVNVDEGDRVKKGQALIELDAPELKDDLDAAVAKLDQAKAVVEQAEVGAQAAKARTTQAEASVESARASVKSAKAAADFAKADADRARQLSLTPGTISKEDFEARVNKADAAMAAMEEAEAKVKTAEAARGAAVTEVGQSEVAIKAAQAGVAVAQAGVRRAETQLSFTKIVAPFDGFVARRTVDVGTTVAPQRQGESVPLITIMRDDVVRAVFDVDQRSASQVAVGDSVVINAPPLAVAFKGKVTRKAGAFESNGIGDSLRVEIQLPNPDGKLRPGMSVTVEVKADQPGK